MSAPARHPAWVLHSRLQAIQITDKQIAREFACHLAGSPPRDSLTKLSTAQIEQADNAMSLLSNEQLRSLFDQWQAARAAEQISFEEIRVATNRAAFESLGKGPAQAWVNRSRR